MLGGRDRALEVAAAATRSRHVFLRSWIVLTKMAARYVPVSKTETIIKKQGS